MIVLNYMKEKHKYLLSFEAEDNSGDDNSTIINTVCITSGGDAVSFSKHKANESRRESSSGHHSTSEYTQFNHNINFTSPTSVTSAAEGILCENKDNSGNGNVGERMVFWQDNNSNRQTLMVIAIIYL